MGRELFLGNVAGCVKCHGLTALGDGGQVDYDDWNKTKKGLSREDVMRRFSLPIQLATPRNLRLGVYRGGGNPVDLYRRIFAGIKGSPMPGATIRDPANTNVAAGLSPDQIWHIVDYVQWLPYEPASRGADMPQLDKPRAN
jgi:mono/diheme cytochrome c family protein